MNTSSDGTETPLLDKTRDSYVDDVGKDVKSSGKKDLSYVGGGLIVINTMFGASLLSLPYVVKISGGIVPYLILLIFVAIGNATSMAVLAKLADEADCRFAYEMCEKILNSQFLSNLYMGGNVIQCYVALLVQITFFADQFQTLIELWIGEDSFGKHDDLYRFVSILACVFLTLPFLIPRKINMLQIPGFLTCISSTSIIVLSVFIHLEERHSTKPKIDLMKGETNFLDFTGAVPILVFGLSAHEIQIMSYASVGENKLIRHWYKVIASVFIVAFGVFLFVGNIGYVTFGDQVQDDFLLNSSPDSVVASLARVAIMISIMASFVETMYVCRYYTENIYRKLKQLEFEEGEKTWTIRRHVQTSVIIICIVIPASLINGFSDIGNIAGVFTSVIVYGLPGLCLVVKFKRIKDKQKTAISETSYELIDEQNKSSFTSSISKMLEISIKSVKNSVDNGLGELILGAALLLAFVLVFILGSISTIYGIVS